MCGIYLSEEPPSEETKYYITCRGKSFQSGAVHGNFHLFSSVLSIRSSVSQPITVPPFTLLYNGEIYNGEESDTLFVARAIKSCMRGNACEDADETDGGYVEKGFAFVNELYTRLKGCRALLECEVALAVTDGRMAYFFKDDIGKRSLGYRTGPFTLSSVNYEAEIDPMKLYIYDSRTKGLHWRFKERTGIVRTYLNRVSSIKEYLFSEKYRNEYSFLTGYENVVTGNVAELLQPRMSPSAKHVLSHMDYVLVLHTLLENSFGARKCCGSPVLFFSGGIDSLVLAIYTHLAADSERDIYLINTAAGGAFDRTQSTSAHHDLQGAFPHRRFVLIENNLDLDEIKKHKSRIEYLMLPKNGRMDFNIACVLYLTAMCASKYGKVVYLGSGADEVFGGYSKYASGAEGASPRAHMLFDLFTISAHNIARDDRAISHWNVEARFPLLDYSVVEFSLSLPMSCFINKERSENKAILRDLLRFHGFDRAANTPKKAMQYGTGMSKYESQIFP